MDAAVSDASNRTKPVVLVVEDVPSVIKVIRAALRDVPVEVVDAADGLAGIDRIKELRPNLVFLDLALPIMTGWDVLRYVREDDEASSIPVVIITAHGDSQTAALAQEAGADRFIAKPFRPAEIRRVIDEFVHLPAVP
jgi:CheY-like chemotaxis protein